MKDIQSLLELMARLRDPQTGCPWDQQQNFHTIAPYTIEEAYEVADAIERNEMDELKGELGDLLFQVVFHAQLASEAKLFDFADIVAAIVEKMIRRHPHVFASARVKDSQQQTEHWEALKADERRQLGLHSVLEDIPLSLPALKRAAKIHKRVASTGFNDSEVPAIISNLHTKVEALEDGIYTTACEDTLEALMGELLFSCTTLAQRLKQDPEQALKKANSRYIRRFQSMEQRFEAEGRILNQVSEEELNQAWQEVLTKETSV